MKFVAFLALALLSASVVAESRDNIKITKINVISNERKTSLKSVGVEAIFRQCALGRDGV